MIDAGEIALAMLHEYLPSRLTAFLTRPFGRSEVDAALVVAWLVALHDIGKITPGFQRKARPMTIPDPPFSLSGMVEEDHSRSTYGFLRDHLPEFGFPPDLACDLARVLGGHHGTFPSDGGRLPRLQNRSASGSWRKAQIEVSDCLAGIFFGGSALQVDPGTTDSAWLIMLAGLTTVSDWIASDESLFPYQSKTAIDLGRYRQEISRPRALLALRHLGWWHPEISPQSGQTRFEDLFFSFDPIGVRQPWIPTVLQTRSAELAGATEGPFLLLIESPMGEGKTEAALWATVAAADRHGKSGWYFALPTQATSNQMFQRLVRFLDRLHPDNRIPFHLLHGMAFLNELFEEMRDRGRKDGDTDLRPCSIDGSGREAPVSGVVAEEWFLGRKRGLLAPFGVGTIDQALLGALNVRHMFVRLFGLAGKTIIIDEVHAYDTYMSTLLDRLLEWLAALGSRVILLSATLPAGRRRQLLMAYSGANPGDSVPQYPRLWLAESGKPVIAEAVPRRGSKEVSLESISGDHPLSDLLGGKLREGGCVAVVRNTVRLAQETFLALKRSSHPGLQGVQLFLFHARFPARDRLGIEKRVLEAFGKNGHRPAKAVLVATQVVEQSLDLDFDLLVSDLAPIDLLLQRAGRVHRHHRHRPAGLETPGVLWLDPGNGRPPPVPFGTHQFVYSPFVLARTRSLLHGKSCLTIPDEMDSSIEAVYGEPGEEAFSGAEGKWLTELESAHLGHLAAQRNVARDLVLPSPLAAGELFMGIDAYRADDDETAQRMTRLGDPTLGVVTAHFTPGGPCFDPDGVSPLPGEVAPGDHGAIRALLENLATVRLGSWFGQAVLASNETPGWWEAVPLLRSCRLAVFRDREWTDGTRTMRLDPELGLYSASAL